MADLTAQATNGILTGRMYDLRHVIIDQARRWESDVMIGDRVPGETVATVWKKLSWKDLLLRSFKKDITTELAAHISRMRNLTQPFIGRIGHNGQGKPEEMRNFYDGPLCGCFGPFTGSDPEAEFDEWALSQIDNPEERAKWRPRLEKDRQKRSSPRSFVLTYGDLTWNNLMVAKDRTSGKYVITGLIDWDRSGFLPDDAEYTVFSAISLVDEAWRKILKAAVPNRNCSKDRLEFTRVLKRACNPVAGKFYCESVIQILVRYELQVSSPAIGNIWVETAPPFYLA
ncbi:hypothetical protein C7999DRAFT_10908 [Corynascus novoguineensis]|uniref:Aminoglycoside phosphotransferase domain-containing protein n=1 Tax=Corynascus novoguineensis TaxID=1126955 RepID=A0AAN7D0A2_9PEZI|nr:hypothetical protein C7999DRAFT_10908 [Corynascus novoguineensis]